MVLQRLWLGFHDGRVHLPHHFHCQLQHSHSRYSTGSQITGMQLSYFPAPYLSTSCCFDVLVLQELSNSFYDIQNVTAAQRLEINKHVRYCMCFLYKVR